MTFPAFLTILTASEAPTRPANLMRAPLLFRFASDHIARREFFASSQELAIPGMIAKSFRQRKKFRVPWGSAQVALDKGWTCESGAPDFSTASGSVVRVFFCCGGVGCRLAQGSVFASVLASILHCLQIRCHHKPAPAAWDPATPTLLQQTQAGGILNHVAWSIGDGNAWGCCNSFLRMAHVLCLRPAAGA